MVEEGTEEMGEQLEEEVWEQMVTEQTVVGEALAPVRLLVDF